MLAVTFNEPMDYTVIENKWTKNPNQNQTLSVNYFRTYTKHLVSNNKLLKYSKYFKAMVFTFTKIANELEGYA